MNALLVDGQPVSDIVHAISAEERGLQYGDGVFETMLLQAGAVRFFADHYARLKSGCERLQIAPPAAEAIRQDIEQLARTARDGVVKLIATRGAGGRGYRAAPDLKPARIASLNPLPPADQDRIAVRWCETRLARNAQLAGIKHLNRIENVLAQNEWRDERIAEGLMLDTEGELISATAANVFLVIEGVLVTPDLRFSGIRGVMRGRVIAMAKNLQLEVEERAVWPRELASATEVFVTNAIRGVRSVMRLDMQTWEAGPVTEQLSSALSR